MEGYVERIVDLYENQRYNQTPYILFLNEYIARNHGQDLTRIILLLLSCAKILFTNIRL